MTNLTRSILASLSLTLAAGAAQAQSTSPTAPPASATPPTQSQPSQQPQPADPAMAARCTSTAKSMIGALDRGDMTAATKSFDPKLHEKLPDDKLKEGWASLGQKFGQRSGFGQTQSQQINDVTVVLLPMTYQRGKIGAQVACNDKGAVLALQIGQIAPPNTSTSPGMTPKAPSGG
ncbi:MAG: DUF3887 domain-containing protein [Dyella sp.]|uniref:DUF3887 domain-containing protein n=1 Tax=Dyella sp. TaxID=1869338 RepID=UPI003F7EE496